MDTEALIASYTEMHSKVTGNAALQKEIANQKKIIELEQKKSKLLGLGSGNCILPHKKSYKTDKDRLVSEAVFESVFSLVI